MAWIFNPFTKKLEYNPITSSISDGDLTHSPDGNSVFDALAGKAASTHASGHAVGEADTVFPADPGADKYLMWDDDPGALVWSAGGGGVTQAEAIMWAIIFGG